jgi:hypothetical protein
MFSVLTLCVTRRPREMAGHVEDQRNAEQLLEDAVAGP